MKWIKILFGMIQFLTRIPIRADFKLENKDYGKGLVLAPIVGLLIGIILYGIFKISILVISVEVVAFLIILGYVLLTGGLHFDGLGDSFDGLFSNRPKEKILEIMRDSRVGTNGVLAIVFVIILDYILIKNINYDYLGRVILLMPVAGRVGSLVGAGISKYARAGDGLGKSFVDYCNKIDVLTGFLISALIFYIVLNLKGLIISGIVLLTSIIITRSLSKKIDGVTGDILGAICELNQSVYLFVVVIMLV